MFPESSKDLMTLNDITIIILDLHITKIKTNKNTELNNSIIRTINALDTFNLESIEKEDSGRIENIINMYNSVAYYSIYLSIKQSGDLALIENAKKDFGPVIKKYWDLFCQ